MSTRVGVAIMLTAFCTRPLAARQQSQDHRGMHPLVSGQETARPAMAMDHSHEFETTPGGGRIVMQRESEDAERVTQLRGHLKQIATLFTAGDFRLPPGVHRSQEVPGTRVMNDRRSKIKFTARSLPRGSSVVISSADPKAIGAIHEFLEFHRREHQALEQPGQ